MASGAKTKRFVMDIPVDLYAWLEQQKPDGMPFRRYVTIILYRQRFPDIERKLYRTSLLSEKASAILTR